MTEVVRRLRLLVGTTVRESPLRSGLALLEVIGKIVATLGMAAIALVVNGALQQDGTLVVLGVVAIALSQPVGQLLQLVGTNARVGMMEQVGFAFDRRIAQVTADIPSLEHHERADYADQLQILQQSRNALGGALNVIVNTLNSVVATVVLLIVLGVMEPRLLVLTLTAVPALMSARARYRWNQRGEDESAEAGRLARHLTSVATDPRAGMELRIFGIRAEIRRRLRDAYQRWWAPLVWARQKAALLTLAETVFFAVCVTTVIGWLLYEAIQGRVSAGALVLGTYAAANVQQAVTGTIYQIGRVGESMRAAGRFLWLVDKAAEIAKQYEGNARPPAELQRGIALEHVSFRYPGSTRWSLRDVSLELPAGAIVALVGENGAGKTTVVKLLLGLHPPSEGRITVDDTDLASYDIASWRRRATGAFQDFARFELTAQESVGLGSLPEIGNEAASAQALEAAGASDVVAGLPSGLATQLGARWEDGVDLSGGQWQKVALGRGLMRREPLLLVLDEPTANLDATAEHALFERQTAAVREHRRRGGVTLLVTHRFSTVRMADLIVVLDEGRVVEVGSHPELMARDGIYAELFDVQAQGYR